MGRFAIYGSVSRRVSAVSGEAKICRKQVQKTCLS